MTYEGDFLEGKKHGNGTFFYSDQSKYIGPFENGNRHGKGIYYWTKDSYWEGTFENGQFHGEGMYFDNGKAPVKLEYFYGTVKN